MTKQTSYSIIAILFIVSGATGLIYQVAWFKYLSLFLGNTTYAQTIVLATFMGGLAIGASLWGRRADRAKSPIRLYALLEFFIGLYCLLYPWLMSAVKYLFVVTVHAFNLPSDGNAVLLLKLLISVLTLLFPTILMGGTLPVLVRFISSNVEDSGKNVATLYFLNSFGAVVGSLLGGFFLVPMAGLQATVLSAGCVNIVIASAAYALGSGNRLSPAESASEHETELPSFPPHFVSLAVGVAGVSGLAAMIYEVAWVRLLIPVLGSSTYSYTLMLVAFISGITIGSWLVSVLIERWKNLFAVLAVCQLLIGASMALMLPLYGRVPYLFWQVGSVLTRSDTSYPIFLAIQFIIGLTLMIIPTIFLGMSLPLASRIATRSVKVLGKSVGTVFSVNTIGTVLGSLAAGLVLIPVIGVRHAMEVGLVLNLVSGIVLTLVDAGVPKIRRGVLVIFATLVGALTFVFGSDWNQIVTLSGVFRQFGNNRQAPATYEEFVRGVRANKVLYYKEGASATVGVVQNQAGTGVQNVLIINGKADASSVGDLPTQVLLGQVPMMLHPHPDTVLVIGFGSGVTTGSVLTHPIKRVDCVEISPEVIAGAKYFEHVNNKPLEDPRARLYIDDALAFLKLSQTNYDAIISEPSNPWIAGIGNLYTIDFFEMCKGRLRPNGVMVQWFHLYEIDDPTFKLVVRTFRTVFPHVVVWQSLTPDLLLVGSKDSLILDENQLSRKLANAAVKKDLERIKIPDAATLASLQMISENPTREYASDGPVNTEDKPLLEHWAPRAFFVNKGANEIARYDERLAFNRTALFLNQLVKQRALTDEERLNIGLLHSDMGRGNLSLGYSMLSSYLEAHPKDLRAVTAMAGLADRLGRREEQVQMLARAVELSPNDPVLLEQYAWVRFTRERIVATQFGAFDVSKTEKLLKRCIELSADTVDFYRIRLADMYFDIQEFQPAFENYKKALQLRERYFADRRVRQDVLLLQLAKCYRRLGDPGRAAGYALQAININPTNEEARELFYSIFLFGGTGTRDTTAKQ
ncbi:MAG: fused MFS/spermidine synthase [Ignavibacteriales bacterium]|nr:fused MFS/spermidine synthase [Ignavibacteriales bacterium]